MKKRFHKYELYILLVALLQFAACTETKIIYRENIHYEVPDELKDTNRTNRFIGDYKKYLEGRKIFLDAGHGGDDRKNIGINKIVVEADINLNVVLYLKEFLVTAGAVVYLSRDSDTTLDLKLRSRLADSSGAEIFISVHHNAPPDSTDSTTNYTSTYYHATELNYEFNPCDRDIARFIQRDLSYAMRNSGGWGSFDGTYSDYLIYPGKGFSVLRETHIPAVLVECGFHTNAYEEKRLSMKEFNRIEAWGIFKGLCRYFENGTPEIAISENSSNSTVDVIISDDFEIDSNSIEVKIDESKFNNINFVPASGLLRIDLKTIMNGEHEVKIVARNIRGNHTFPFIKIINKKN